MDDYNLFSNNYDDEPRPAENKPLIQLYERLCALLGALPPDSTSSTLRDGSGERFNGYIDQLIELTGDQSLSDFKLIIHSSARPTSSSGKTYVLGNDYVRQLSGVTALLHKVDPTISYYCGHPPEVKYGKVPSQVSSPTTVNNHVNSHQNASQTTNITVEFTQTIINMTESLTRFEAEFPDPESKENKFAKALKLGLPAAKDTLGIIAKTLQIAGELGIDPHTTLKALGLSL